MGLFSSGGLVPSGRIGFDRKPGFARLTLLQEENRTGHLTMHPISLLSCRSFYAENKDWRQRVENKDWRQRVLEWVLPLIMPE